ncbi:Hydrogen peroxide-inducible genes activator [Bathymodiolus thermophilus thioautotrophic gill symbiont]|uniref:Transcriptional regulator VC0732, LysR family n=1 Tax=Bathymodiolus thermophilus thioautotrophic gill symbiont TaxID=2360 RepID=A0A3G3INV9_9GAMM|nr:LysR substrate-binding domain-containing protein [Bathymodiolus thermophilus thioautotrophic gill symbiont]AYQ57491.1 hypothetical protein MS2017_1817 [Bathymodiolus thermophilus thioautotrophic gill symbiont]CAB5503433.1 Transcriptional regulator VC0732, LysR family [Bathymodiolus thermophilus thioautotrophic gill symbiont]CAB5504749.1 Transcriptional regulator VC0732, LysR family [Bathymodiolus thermophilus thioautotrophic gill symbiont]SGZ96404.1 Hydrogen peroxide-inducible genes activato
MTPSLKNLKYLLALKQHLHFSKAAKACFVSQSTLSSGINKLEENLNAKLVERTNKSVLFTPLGEKVAKKAQEVIFSMQDLVKISQLDFFNSSIKIGVIPTISAYLLPDFLSKLKQKYPKLRLVVTEDTSQNLIEKIEKMQLDFAIFAFPFEESKIVIQQTVFTDELVLVKHKHHQHKSIADGSLLLLEQGHCLRKHILNNAQIHKKHISEFSFSSLETLVAMIDMRCGVSFLPKMAIDNGILDKYPNLIIDKNQKKLSRGIGIIYRKNNPWQKNIIILSNFLKPLHKI